MPNFDILALWSTEFLLTVGDDNGNVYGIFNSYPDASLEAGLSLAWTGFICIILAGGALVFSSDTDKLVIDPIESMINKVKKIA